MKCYKLNFPPIVNINEQSTYYDALTFHFIVHVHLVANSQHTVIYNGFFSWCKLVGLLLGKATH